MLVKQNFDQKFISRKRSLFFLWFFLFFSSLAFSQNPAIDSLLKKVAASQRSYSDTFYQAGHIPSQRFYLKKKNYKREDDNIFFTGLVVWTLRSQRSKLSTQNQILVDSICKNAVRNYPLYRNKKGDCSYNFWRTNPSHHFPNDSYFSSREKFAMPDDIDDSAIIYLSGEYSDSLMNKFKEKMALYANGVNGRQIHAVFRHYKHRKAYDTWFGKKMPLEFDICVHCNVIRFVLDNKMELNEYDRATIQLIQDIVLADDHIRHGPCVSPEYKNASIILYHLARLVSEHPEAFPLIREKLIADLTKHFEKTKVPMEKLLLNTSLARFGLPQKEMKALTKKDFEGFYFFTADLTNTQRDPIKRWLSTSRWTKFYFQSEGYYWSLLLENACMKLP